MHKLYVLVRGDLSKSQQAVQACHAVAEYMLYDNIQSCSCGRCSEHKHWTNNTIVLLKVSKEELRAWYEDLKKSKYPWSVFYEPDIHSDTALACYDIDGELQHRMKDLPLL